MNEQYNIIELPETKEGKFGGYKVEPRYAKRLITTRVHPIQIHLKYDMNKELDNIKSNNGIQR